MPPVPASPPEDFADPLPMDPVIEAFETLASQRVILASHAVSSFDGLIHPVHQCGRVSDGS
jgi:hypothetical protein